MTIAMDAMVPWLATTAVIVFLAGCVWHNRRSGYQSEPIEKIQLGEAIALIKQSLTWSESPEPSPALLISTQTNQLINLNSALQNRQQVAPYQENQVEVPVDAEVKTVEEEVVKS